MSTRILKAETKAYNCFDSSLHLTVVKFPFKNKNKNKEDNSPSTLYYRVIDESYLLFLVWCNGLANSKSTISKVERLRRHILFFSWMLLEWQLENIEVEPLNLSSLARQVISCLASQLLATELIRQVNAQKHRLSP